MGTDQQAPTGHGVTPLNKEIVLYPPKKDWQGVRTRSGKTEADKAAEDLKHWDFDFST